MCIGAVLLLFSATAAPAQRDPEKQLQQVRERIEDLQRSIRRDTDRRDALSAQLRDAEEKVRGARGRLGSVRQRLAASDARLAELTAERERTERTGSLILENAGSATCLGSGCQRRGALIRYLLQWRARFMNQLMQRANDT